MMTTYNNCMDKDGVFGVVLEPLIGNGIVFSKTTEDYKRKRKHIAHAFYKNHMYDMQENLKRIIKETFSGWLELIDASDSKSTVLDINTVFNLLFSKNIITIACGNIEIYDHEVEL